MAPVEPPEVLRVAVVYCPQPHDCDCVELLLAPGATLADALQASGVLTRRGLDPAGLRLGVWGQVRDAGSPLRDLDRVEIYRPLTVDPKEARRLRYRRHLALHAKG